MVKTEMLQVELIYALPEQQLLIPLSVADGATLQDAIEQSAIMARYPQLEAKYLRAGIFGREVPLTQPLEQGDRVEIYRLLSADPKAARRARARLRKR